MRTLNHLLVQTPVISNEKIVLCYFIGIDDLGVLPAGGTGGLQRSREAVPRG